MKVADLVGPVTDKLLLEHHPLSLELLTPPRQCCRTWMTPVYSLKPARLQLGDVAVAVVPGRRRPSVQLHVDERRQFVENGADAAVVAGEQLVGRRTEYERRLVECVDEVVTVERSPASPTDARSLIWSCCSCACVNSYDDERLVGEKGRLDINGQRDQSPRVTNTSSC